MIEVEVDSSDTIGNGKKVYLLNTNNRNNNFSCQWYFQGNILLEDDKTFDDYEMEDGDIIFQKALLETRLDRFRYKFNDSDKLSQKSKEVKTLYIRNVTTNEIKEVNIG